MKMYIIVFLILYLSDSIAQTPNKLILAFQTGSTFYLQNKLNNIYSFKHNICIEYSISKLSLASGFELRNRLFTKKNNYTDIIQQHNYHFQSIPFYLKYNIDFTNKSSLNTLVGISITNQFKNGIIKYINNNNDIISSEHIPKQRWGTSICLGAEYNYHLTNRASLSLVLIGTINSYDPYYPKATYRIYKDGIMISTQFGFAYQIFPVK